MSTAIHASTSGVFLVSFSFLFFFLVSLEQEGGEKPNLRSYLDARGPKLRGGNCVSRKQQWLSPSRAAIRRARFFIEYEKEDTRVLKARSPGDQLKLEKMIVAVWIDSVASLTIFLMVK